MTTKNDGGYVASPMLARTVELLCTPGADHSYTGYGEAVRKAFLEAHPSFANINVVLLGGGAAPIETYVEAFAIKMAKTFEATHADADGAVSAQVSVTCIRQTEVQLLEDFGIDVIVPPALSEMN